MKTLKLILPVTLLLFTLGCASTEINAYRTLAATSIAVEGARQGFITQCNAGKVDRATYDTAAMVYQKYQSSMVLAFDAVDVYRKTKGSVAPVQAALGAVLTNAPEAITAFQTLIKK